MTNSKKNKISYTKDSISKEVARDIKFSPDHVREVIECIEEKVAKHLAEADERNDVSVRLFTGISFNSEYVPEREYVSSLSGEKSTASARIRPKAHITRNYRDKITKRAMNA